MNFRIATFILSIILICMISFKAIKKRTTYKKLRNYLAREQYDEFFKLIDAPLTNALYPDGRHRRKAGGPCVHCVE